MESRTRREILVLAGVCVVAIASCAAWKRQPEKKPAAPMPEQVTSTEVTIGQGLVGTMVLPRGDRPHPAVLMLHGFGSDRNEVHQMFERTAYALAEEEIASLRIDFRGSGESEGDFADTTIAGLVSDAGGALTWLREQPRIDPARIGLLGFSLGGGIAILIAGERAYEVNSVVVWSTVGDLEADFLALLGDDAFDRARRGETVTRDLGWREVTLGPAFFAGLDDHSIAAALRLYNGPFLAIAGTDDPLARHARPLAELVDGMTVMVRDADHIFRSSSDIKTQVDTVIQTTIVRFNGTLKWQ